MRGAFLARGRKNAVRCGELLHDETFQFCQLKRGFGLVYPNYSERELGSIQNRNANKLHKENLSSVMEGNDGRTQ